MHAILHELNGPIRYPNHKKGSEDGLSLSLSLYIQDIKNILSEKVSGI